MNGNLSMQNQNIIEISNLVFAYKEKIILNISDFKMKKKEKVFLFGPSGSGKSTFLEVISGLKVAQKGQIKILNEDIALLSEKSRDKFRGHNLAFIFQNFNLIPYLNVKENICLAKELLDKKQNNLLFKKITLRLGLDNLLEKNVLELSVGQQQRVAAARSLYSEPKLILADEPTSSLDYDHRERFLKLLFDLSDEIDASVLFVSHDRSVEKLFDRSFSLADMNSILM